MIMPSFFPALLLSLLLLCSAQVGVAAPAVTDTAASTQVSTSAEAVMQQFDGGEEEDSPQRKIETERKHQILFLMGLSLLVLLLLTGTLGIAMVVFDKDVFIPHMIFAGLSLTLACVHSATAIAWFWPW